jgi:hypothetical protein
VTFNPRKECEERDYLVSFFVVSSLDVHVVKHRERGERGEMRTECRLSEV